jgi:hypothetical protein
MALHTERCSHRELDALTQTDTFNHRRLFATDAVGHTETFGRLTSRDLGISIGAVDPNAPIQVGGLAGVVAIIDALVTLRYFAFGLNEVHEETEARRARERSRLSALDDFARTLSTADAVDDRVA